MRCSVPIARPDSLSRQKAYIGNGAKRLSRLRTLYQSVTGSFDTSSAKSHLFCNAVPRCPRIKPSFFVTCRTVSSSGLLGPSVILINCCIVSLLCRVSLKSGQRSTIPSTIIKPKFGISSTNFLRTFTLSETEYLRRWKAKYCAGF